MLFTELEFDSSLLLIFSIFVGFDCTAVGVDGVDGVIESQTASSGSQQSVMRMRGTVMSSG